MCVFSPFLQELVGRTGEGASRTVLGMLGAGAGGVVNSDTTSLEKHGKQRAVLPPNHIRRTRTDHGQNSARVMSTVCP